MNMCIISAYRESVYTLSQAMNDYTTRTAQWNVRNVLTHDVLSAKHILI